MLYDVTTFDCCSGQAIMLSLYLLICTAFFTIDGWTCFSFSTKAKLEPFLLLSVSLDQQQQKAMH